MFSKILIANRGEIACRVMRTAKRMGIGTVAVFSEADDGALHTREADEAVCIGPAPAARSYLAIDNILRAVKETGAEAVHPGYGFLAENEAFAAALEKVGVVFIGPGAATIKTMGDKIEAKKLARAAGLEVVPGHLGAVSDEAEAVAIARAVGYPVMIKAAAGGGGKGMRVARDDDEMAEGCERAVSEAKASFGDGRVFIEKFIERPRHIEIQVLADAHGNVVHLFERECSIQRRHQKVIEEAPSPLLDAATRKAMGAQAVALAREVRYRSAGTVEFMVDQQGRYYFLEMNTRLQVEHPVTELITGLDLVEEMIRIAAGEPLSVRQQDVGIAGWAIEGRIYAEDPRRDFLPSAGRLVGYRPPAEDEHLRIDSGVAEGSEITTFYDPMIAKLCAFGGDRDEAIERMRLALDEFHIRGISHNMGFLAAVLDHPMFRRGDLSTHFIDEAYPGGFRGAELGREAREALVAVAAAVHCRYMEREAASGDLRMGRGSASERDWVVTLAGQDHAVRVGNAGRGYKVVLGGRALAVEGEWRLGQPLFRGGVNGRTMNVQIERSAEGYRLVHGGAELVAVVRTPRAAELAALMPARKAVGASNLLRSPMPGLVLSIAVEEGQKVVTGAVLAVVEAMKMENVLRAEQDGTVARVLSRPGDSLALDQVILEFEVGGTAPGGGG